LSYAPLLWNQSDEGHHRKHYQCNTRLRRQWSLTGRGGGLSADDRDSHKINRLFIAG